ncbi:N-acetyl-gamma-glutamyl-phosphate reductase [Poriferisphaera corsica]|uniref:N-acetyl-gamma-glutamyl-phosphate reductase n=1 Tax=Poriferisphaera corsica TaxID=2528020 RepID=A0A517YX06_9BACT|nr:N-acetyl-gamma-glutamyl-phosphate reductase [Poriferisphaera corsica]QDU34737.1 N-acetyl-gamma-glutamyl-phosphate reductase [Poriferisphaera corsica]
MNSIKAAIIGPTGYTGVYLIDILLRHPQAELAYLASHRDQLPDIRDEFPQLRGRIDDEIAQCRPIDPQAIAAECDVAFLALPHRAAMAYAPKLLEAGLKVVDLSADYRLDSQSLYEEVYETPHGDPSNLEIAAYGLPELFRDKIKDADLVANPGCYPSAAALGVAPLITHSLVKLDKIVINAASGVTGAGRKAAPHLHYPEQNESFFAYGKIGGHRHQCEIEQTYKRIAGKDVPALFVPHLLPLDCGILETIYLEPATDDVTEAELFEAFEDTYKDEPFVRVLEGMPNVKHVRNTNFCDVTVRLTQQGDNQTIVVFSAIDNMVKGASGAAVQNMNLLFDLPETMGLL